MEEVKLDTFAESRVGRIFNFFIPRNVTLPTMLSLGALDIATTTALAFAINGIRDHNWFEFGLGAGISVNTGLVTTLTRLLIIDGKER